MGVFLRDACIDDALLILNWRNDFETRQNSFNKNIIDYNDHLAWYQKKLEDNNCFMFILVDNTECVGHIRIDKFNNVGKISYMIAPKKRKMGYGKLIIELIDNIIPSEISILVGFVDRNNIPSRKCFITNNYSELIEDNIICYIKSSIN